MRMRLCTAKGVPAIFHRLSMPKVLCDASDCIFCENVECNANSINIEPFEGCEDYVCYTETADYQSPYGLPI